VVLVVLLSLLPVVLVVLVVLAVLLCVCGGKLAAVAPTVLANLTEINLALPQLEGEVLAFAIAMGMALWMEVRWGMLAVPHLALAPLCVALPVALAVVVVLLLLPVVPAVVVVFPVVVLWGRQQAKSSPQSKLCRRPGGDHFLAIMVSTQWICGT
jgi:hypothetical protein